RRRHRPVAALQLSRVRLEVAEAPSRRRLRAGDGAPVPREFLQPLSQRELWRARGGGCRQRHRQGRATLPTVTYAPIRIESYENKTGEFALIHEVMKVGAGSRIIQSVIRGPLYLNRNTQIGPDADVGAWFGMNESCFIARA